jgi:DNA-binding transcriptional MerR regulator
MRRATMNELRSVAGDAARTPDKSPDAFRTISEVADDLDLPQHVLRFWETRFAQLKPLKRGGGRRYYRPDDIDLLRGIRHLLYGQGYTIKGVQRILKQEGLRFVQAIGRGERSAPTPVPARPDESRPNQSAAEPAVPATAAGAERGAPSGLSAADIGRLRAALDELVECERVLAALRLVEDAPA